MEIKDNIRDLGFWISFGILLVGLLSLLYFWSSNWTPSTENIGAVGLVLSFLGLFCTIFLGTGIKKSATLILFGFVFWLGPLLWRGSMGPELSFYWIPAFICLGVGLLYGVWFYFGGPSK